MASSDTARNPRLVGPVDARVSVFMMIWALHMRWWTLYITLGGVVLFSLLVWFGISLENAWGADPVQDFGGRVHPDGIPMAGLSPEPVVSVAMSVSYNGLQVSQYFPKYRDFTTITQAAIYHVMDKINGCPRKCLGI